MGFAEKPERLERAGTKSGNCSETADEGRESHQDG